MGMLFDMIREEHEKALEAARAPPDLPTPRSPRQDVERSGNSRASPRQWVHPDTVAFADVPVLRRRRQVPPSARVRNSPRRHVPPPTPGFSFGVSPRPPVFIDAPVGPRSPARKASQAEEEAAAPR